MTLGTRDHSKSFFSVNRAKKFMAELAANPECHDIAMWTGKDGFGQNEYKVVWNYGWSLDD